MKKLFLVVVAIALVGGVKAQTEITVGPKVGLNVTNITNSPDGKNKISVSAGAFAEFRFNDFWAIQPEVVYSRQGFKTKINDHKAWTRVNYINVPVLAKIFVWDGLSVDLGPQFGFALNSKTRYKEDGDTVKAKNKHFNTFDFSFAMGLSYDFGRIMLSARYNLGLTDVFEKDYFDGHNNKNHVFQLSAGLRLGDLF